MLILLKQQARSATILLRETNFNNFAKVNVKRFFKVTVKVSVVNCPKFKPRLAPSIFTRSLVSNNARQNLHRYALLKAIMNYESHFHRRTHSSDLYSSLCRARSYIEIKSLMKLFTCILWKRQVDTWWKDKKCTREVFFERAFRKICRNVWLNG